MTASIMAHHAPDDQPPLAWARRYAELGWAAIPLCGPAHRCPHPGKTPWEPHRQQHLTGWQTRGVPTEAEIAAWLATPTGPRCNLGVLTGRVSGIVAVDLDSPDSEALLCRLADDLPATCEYVTGRGRRLVYALPPGVDIPSRVIPDGTAQVEILAERRVMVVPPSRHPTGRRYEWLPGRDPWTMRPAPAPAWLLRLARRPAPSTVPAELAGLARGPVPEGRRHTAACRLAGHLLARGVAAEVVAELLVAWAQVRCDPPLPEAEVLRIVADLSLAEQTRHPARALAAEALRRAEERGLDVRRLWRHVRRVAEGVASRV